MNEKCCTCGHALVVHGDPGHGCNHHFPGVGYCPCEEYLRHHRAKVTFVLETPDGADAGMETREYEGGTPGDIEEEIDYDAGPKGDFIRAGLQVGDIWYDARTYTEADLA